MQARAERARSYRYRAEELRSIADPWIDQAARLVLEQIAGEYDRRATHLENCTLNGLSRPESIA
ncbi:MAG TPA: hypothetical protein VHU23_13995 [Rhizomicrobium sp.]|jgi:hypothetical protein|nr:hypothetical protein [Rhizomicrobium sp.]